MTDRDNEIANKLKHRWSEKVPIVDMRVFGSRARGDNEVDSDMDVFLEIEKYSREIEEIIRDIAWETGLEYLVHVSPLIFSRDEVEYSPLRSSPILAHIREEGVMV